MNVWAIVGGTVLAVAAGGALLGYVGYRRGAAEAERAYREVLDRPAAPQARFEPSQVEQLPEIARRYFRHAIAPGTPFYSTAEVQMEGSFLLGDRKKFQTYAMSARQALRPPEQFVWIPELQSGPISITGSDALAGGRAWTRFWMLRLLPVANDQSSPDLVRSAQFRAAVEGALWLPTSLLPERGVEWIQAGPDKADVVLKKLRPEPIKLTLTLDKDGRVREVVGQRWSNANPSKRFQLQPFGGTMSEETTFQGLTIPARIAVGNLYGTPDYLPFFQAHITRARYR